MTTENKLNIGDRVKFRRFEGEIKDLFTKGELDICRVKFDGVAVDFNLRPTSLTRLDGAVLEVSLKED